MQLANPGALRAAYSSMRLCRIAAKSQLQNSPEPAAEKTGRRLLHVAEKGEVAAAGQADGAFPAPTGGREPPAAEIRESPGHL